MTPSVALIGALAGIGAILARRWLDVVEVRGRSMAPALLPGDRLVVSRLARPPRVGDVVLAYDPREPSRELIKRVSAAIGRSVTLHGDNAGASSDARTFGAVAGASVEWRAVLRYWPPARVGAIPQAPLRLESVEFGEPACPFPEALLAGPEDAAATPSRR